MRREALAKVRAALKGFKFNNLDLPYAGEFSTTSTCCGQKELTGISGDSCKEIALLIQRCVGQASSVMYYGVDAKTIANLKTLGFVEVYSFRNSHTKRIVHALVLK